MRGFRFQLATIAALAMVVVAARDARAIRFGQNDAVELRGHFYTQYTVATEHSQEYTQPSIAAGNMKQWRNFYNPELEADFRKLTGWRGGFLDQLTGRLTIWGFYDGIYDFGPEAWDRTLDLTKNAGVDAALYSEGHSVQQALDNKGRRRDGREFYGRRTRVNEAYFNVAKGPLFVRVGRQAISWGEADTIGLLDANNPFDVLLVPGVQIDLDEARIPLWTLRTTYELFAAAGPFQSGFLDAYWVPGWLDTTVGYLNIQSVSPYSQPPPLQPPAIQVFDKLPRYETGNSRYGFKFQTVINRDYNWSIWFYRAFQQVPVPTIKGVSAANPDGPGQYVTTTMNHGLTNVIGTAMSWYSEALNSIVRTEIELFNDEPNFIPYKALGAPVNSGFTERGSYETANVMRGEFGLDHNFFVPMLNPSASFLGIVSVVWTANLSETSDRDYYTPIIKPSAIDRQLAGGPLAGQMANCGSKNAPTPKGCDYMNMDVFEAFLQATVRSDFAGGRVQPGLTTIGTMRGALLFAPSVLYRVNDSLLFDVKYVNTHTFGSGNNGYTPGVGLLRDRDQLWFRATFQLN